MVGKATLIMKNGMSIDLANSEVIINGEMMENIDEIIDTITGIHDMIFITQRQTAADGKVHIFNYTFPKEAYNWGYTHEEEAVDDNERAD